MTMIEKAPSLIPFEKIVKKMVNLQFDGTIKKLQDEYLYWDKVKYKKHDFSPLELWSALKTYRKLGYKKVQFGKYFFNYMKTDFIEKTIHQFDMHIGGTLSSNIGIAETDKHKFIISSILEEAISSSQMEGANTTRKKAKEMIQQQKKPKNKSEQMIFNNYLTMKHISQNKTEKITPENLLYIHQLITQKTLENPDFEGAFRDNDEIFVVNYSSSEVVHTPPPYQEIPELIADLCYFFNEETQDFIHPIIKAIIIHFMIGWIHPFTDGNGRTARTLFYWYMLKNGYWLTEFLSISQIIKDTKNQYEKSFLYSEIDENDLTYFISYHIKAMEKAFERLKIYINQKQKEVKQASEFMKIDGVNDRMAQILKIMNDDGDRILNSKELESRFNVSNFTARSDLKALVNLGFLEIIQVSKQKQNFIKSANFDVNLKKLLKTQQK